jgi:hypothetical protein
MLISVTTSIIFQVEQDKKDKLWYIRAYNETGGMEITSWWGQDSKIKAINQFWSSFDVLIYDHETHKTYDKDDFDNGVVRESRKQ